MTAAKRAAKGRAVACAADGAPIEPMEAKLVAALPTGPGWQYEPKWDGFRAIVRRAGTQVEITSRSGKPLGRYFPELVAMLEEIDEDCFALDGEIILPVNGALSFDALQARLHPAASRVARLARETPARLILFDCLARGDRALADQPLQERRQVLEAFHARHGSAHLKLSPATEAREKAEEWLRRSGGALDGVVAKRLDEPYRPGARAMLKVKQRRTADCVIGGFRREAEGGAVASLLLGLYDESGLLHHVGFVSGLQAVTRTALASMLEPLVGGAGFTGKAPGGPSRWNAGKASSWVPVAPDLVVEVLYDQVTAERFRHAARLLRLRPDKAPQSCTFKQLEPAIDPARMFNLA